MPMKVVAAVFVALAFAAPAAAQPKLTPAQEAAITRSIDVFVNHAVKRSNPARRPSTWSRPRCGPR